MQKEELKELVKVVHDFIDVYQKYRKDKISEHLEIAYQNVITDLKNEIVMSILEEIPVE